MTTLIDNAFVYQEGEFRSGAVLVEGRHIAGLLWNPADRAAARIHARERIDAAGDYLIPGLIDAHAHAYGGLLRGTENSLPLETWALSTVAYGRALDGPSIQASILLGAAERIRAGITGLVDHTPQVHLAEAALAAHEASGLRVAYAPFLHDIADQDFLEIPLDDAARTATGSPPKLDPDAYAGRFAEILETAGAGSGRISVQLGPNAPQRCSPAAFALWRQLRDRHGLRVHTHLLETRAQAVAGRKAWKGGTVGEMARQGLLGPELSVAHGIWTSPAERRLLARHGVAVSHNPASNLMLGSGLMPLAAYEALGVPLALGSDSANTGGRADPFEIMRLAMMLPRPGERDPGRWPQPGRMFELATRGGARILGRPDDLGRIAPGALADLVLVRRASAGMQALEPGIGALVQHGGPEAVAAVMVDGRWLLRDGRILAFDEAEILANARNAAADVARRAAPFLAQTAPALPGIAAFLMR